MLGDACSTGHCIPIAKGGRGSGEWGAGIVTRLLLLLLHRCCFHTLGLSLVIADAGLKKSTREEVPLGTDSVNSGVNPRTGVGPSVPQVKVASELSRR